MARNWTPQTKKDLMAQRLKDRMCTLCGAPNDRPNYRHCESCAHKKSQYDKQTRAQRIIDKLCTTCGKKRPLHGYKTCTTCRGLWPKEPQNDD